MTTGISPESLFCSIGGTDRSISDSEIKGALSSFLQKLGPREDVLILPPDFTRYHSQAGKITKFICEYFNFITGEEDEANEAEVVKRAKLSDDCTERRTKSQSKPNITILPALGTHFPMTEAQIKSMFGSELASKQSPNPFIVHDWRKDVVTIGHAPPEMVCVVQFTSFGFIAPFIPLSLSIPLLIIGDIGILGQ